MKSQSKTSTKAEVQTSPTPSPEREFLHDISTPLSAALLTSGLLQEALLEKKETDVKILKMAQNLVRSLDKLNELVLSKREELINKELGPDEDRESA